MTTRINKIIAGQHTNKAAGVIGPKDWAPKLKNTIATIIVPNCVSCAGHNINELVRALVAAVLLVKARETGKPVRQMTNVICPEQGTVAWNLSVYPMIKLEEYLLDIFNKMTKVEERKAVILQNDIERQQTLHPHQLRMQRNPYRQMIKELDNENKRLISLAETQNLAAVYHAAWSEAYLIHFQELNGKDQYFTDARTVSAHKTHQQLCENMIENNISIKINEGMVKMYFDLYYAYVAKNHAEFLREHPEIVLSK